MKLYDYLREEKMTAFDLAVMADVSPTIISKILSGTGDLWLSIAMRISIATGGKVQPQEMISHETVMRKVKRVPKRHMQKIVLVESKTKSKPKEVNKNKKARDK